MTGEALEGDVGDVKSSRLEDWGAARGGSGGEVTENACEGVGWNWSETTLKRHQRAHVVDFWSSSAHLVRNLEHFEDGWSP